MTGDDIYLAGAKAAYDEAFRLFDLGWTLDAVEREMRARIEAQSAPGPYRDGLEFGLEVAMWERMGWLDGLVHGRKGRPVPSEDELLQAYLVGYRAGIARRREKALRAAQLRRAIAKRPARDPDRPVLRVINGKKEP